MPSYSITEPHPTVAASTWCHAGRGGAGNFFKAPKAVTSPSGVPTPITPTMSNSTSATTKFHSGRGGAGNAHSSLERPVISFEDEYEQRRERTESASQPAFTGRGGAGNFKSASSSSSPFGASKQSRKGSDASTASNASTKSCSSTRSGILGRLSASLSNRQ